MTRAPALTEATMDKMTVDELERLERFTSGTLKHHLAPGMTAQYVAALKLAKTALTPPPDVAGLVSELRGLIEKATPGPWEAHFENAYHPGTANISAVNWIALASVVTHINGMMRPEERGLANARLIAAANPANMTKLLDCVTSLSARNRGLEAENAQLKLEKSGMQKEWLEIAALKVRQDCSACDGSGHAGPEEECRYCGEPMRAIFALIPQEPGEKGK